MDAKPLARRTFLRVAIILLIVVGLALVVYRASVRQPGTLRVGILQLVSHPSLDHIRDGIIQELQATEGDLHAKISFDVQNGQGDMKLIKTMADRFAAGRYDLIIPITTPAAQAVVNADNKTRIVFGAVTDPIAAGIVKNLDAPGGNVTGVSDLWPIAQQINLALKLVPSARTIGTVYNPGEANSRTIIVLIRDACNKKHVALREATVAQGSEVLGAARSLVGNVDLIFTAADSTVGAAYESILKVARENRIPVFAGDGDSVKRGAVATVGLDYQNVGRLTGQLAAKVLRGASPGSLPVVLVTDTKPVINASAARFFGVRVPEDLLKTAELVGPSTSQP